MLRKSNPQNHDLQTAVEHGVMFKPNYFSGKIMIFRTLAKYFLITLALAVMYGCASKPQSLSNLNPVSDKKSFILKEPIIESLAKNNKLQIAVMNGKYTAVYENEYGVFYEGEAYSVIYSAREDLFMVRAGGLYIPKEKEKFVRPFIYFNKNWQQTENLKASVELANKIKSTIAEGGKPDTRNEVVGGGLIIDSIINSAKGELIFISGDGEYWSFSKQSSNALVRDLAN
ncbi:hypothetical protein [Cellvibrio sp. pealriver]|uniref:hypothetical protein n=1 Tax=Cellvibrio sp. pealriver TaxID=1622269 RepID=UPI0018CEB53E|nr:hypothetical protein [Cellvibrio sp. pealriver]